MRRMALAWVAVATFIAPMAAAASATAGHRRAAEELLGVLNFERTMMAGASAMADAMIQQNVALTPYRDVILKWAESILTWKNFGPRVTTMYVESFSESELREMTTFYKTPTGQKALQVMPEMMRRGALLGGEVAKEHSAELERMVRARAAELDKATTKP
jgi:hypothetical protein